MGTPPRCRGATAYSEGRRGPLASMPPMPCYVALLRGINVGGKNLIKMPALKACFEADGFADVATFIQSGNVLFASPEAHVAGLTQRIEEMLGYTFGYEATVVVRNRAQMRAIVEHAPKGFGTEPAAYRYDVIFLKPPLTSKIAIEERAHEARRRRSTRWHRRALLLETHREGHPEPAQQDRFLADLRRCDDPELEHDDEAVVDDERSFGQVNITDVPPTDRLVRWTRGRC